MKPKKYYVLIAGIILFLLVTIVFIRFFVGGDEDTWIKDSRGVYVKHGNPSEVPSYVIWQNATIACAQEKFSTFTEEIDSQCLGDCGMYAVDIVHVPRTDEDDLTENQCADYLSGKLSHFIELDGTGEIVRIE